MKISGFGPRRGRSAARTAAGLVVVSALAITLGEVVVAASGTRPVTWVAVVITLALLALGAALWFGYERLPGWSWFVLAIIALCFGLSLSLVTQDAGGGSQVGLLLPVVYAGAFLQPGAAWTVAAVAVLSDAVLVFTLLPVDRAITDHAFVLVAIIAVTGVLVKAGQRQDALVAQLERVASIDELTGLATRRTLEEAVYEAFEARRRDGPDRDLGVLAGQPVPRATADRGDLGSALMLIDLDNFKEINDALGHPVGDQVLVHVAALLRKAVRRGDTVARFGGDEIAVLVPDVTREEATRLAETLRDVVQRHPARGPRGPIELTVSVGVAHSRACDAGMEELYRTSDIALYRAKRDGRDRVIVLDTAQRARDDEPVS